MLQHEIYKLFCDRFPEYCRPDDIWFPNGKNSVRIRQSNGQELVFTYHSRKNWRLETVESFISRLKGEK